MCALPTNKFNVETIEGKIMKILRKNSAPRYKRDNIVSYLLVSQSTSESEKLTVTMVEMEPGGKQHIHAHDPEQMYYILEGSGEMTVNEETSEVNAGDCIFFASQAKHGLINTGKSTLRYLSAASPSFTASECKEFWPLPRLDDETK
jgi:quercetin dioxygenase-like cupin family protein